MGERTLGGHWCTSKKTVSINLVEDQKDRKESIQSVYRLQKQEVCQVLKKASAVRRKRAAGNPGGKPTNVKTF